MKKSLPKIPVERQIQIDNVKGSYYSAVGNLNQQWVILHELFHEIFIHISRVDYEIGRAIWYAIESDRLQRELLKRCVKAKASNFHTDPRWQADLAKLLLTADKLADTRNNAIHSPAALRISGSLSNLPKMVPRTFAGHPRAAQLEKSGVDLLGEFEFTANRIQVLAEYAYDIILSFENSVEHRWPEPFRMPDRKPST